MGCAASSVDGISVGDRVGDPLHPGTVVAVYQSSRQAKVRFDDGRLWTTEARFLRHHEPNAPQPAVAMVMEPQGEAFSQPSSCVYNAAPSQYGLPYNSGVVNMHTAQAVTMPVTPSSTPPAQYGLPYSSGGVNMQTAQAVAISETNPSAVHLQTAQAIAVSDPNPSANHHLPYGGTNMQTAQAVVIADAAPTPTQPTVVTGVQVA
ncbi:MAG: hypothetical protein SGPRY_001191 [Prymnesium sp.]